MTAKQKQAEANLEYPFNEKHLLTEPKLINWIAEVSYDDPAAGRKRVRAQFRYAKDRGIGFSQLSEPAFLEWAASKWPNISEARCFPSAIRTLSGNIQMGEFKWGVQGVNSPSDPAELLAAHVKEVTERIRLQGEYDRVRAELDEATAELSWRREKERVLRLKKSKAGKKGGRPRN